MNKSDENAYIKVSSCERKRKLPKKPGKHSPKPEKKRKTEHDKNNSCAAFIDEEISIEAKVKVCPDVSIGKVTIKCLESSIEPCSKHKDSSSEECTLYVNQLIRVKIPVRFSAKVKAEERGISCELHESDESSDESSNESSHFAVESSDESSDFSDESSESSS
ncbi:hypothetical protein QE429_004734 [Bacillus sp. SORGH_AS 510]|uniref:hypothetical protein n=1 Tax=Bacillus sp. SORGH_AS_0510 TaxID=3041771 RepID=UPI002782A36C|nr:hypothetical protein [Bacillus sp. SORGH_AS_0510]MDQ1147907.1 hypothetical protein [Bacillus sp. SORGH_AS_0510]